MISRNEQISNNIPNRSQYASLVHRIYWTVYREIGMFLPESLLCKVSATTQASEQTIDVRLYYSLLQSWGTSY